MNIVKNIHHEFIKRLLHHLLLKQQLRMKCKWNLFQKKKLQRLLLKELIHILLNQVLLFFFFLNLVGIPLSENNGIRSEPNKSAIDLAVKALKEKEHVQKSFFTLILINRPTSSSIVAYKPKEQKKAISDVFLISLSFIHSLVLH